MSKESAAQSFDKLVAAIASLGYPEEFGTLIAMSLGTEKTMSRMTAYIYKARPQSAEEIADEMLSIKAEFAKYREKKIAEYYNGKLNRLMEEGLEAGEAGHDEPGRGGAGSPDPDKKSRERSEEPGIPGREEPGGKG